MPRKKLGNKSKLKGRESDSSGFYTQQFLLAVAAKTFCSSRLLAPHTKHIQTMNGTLFKYGPGSAQLAFKTPATRPCHPSGPSAEVHLVLVGGLTDGTC